MPSAKPHRHGLFAVGDAKLYYEARGDGRPLLFIHAGIADSRMWDEQFAEMAHAFRVVRYDLRGFGQTRPGSEPFTDWQDLAYLIEFLQLGPAVLVGASMGARVAVELTLMRPDLVWGLILVSPGLFDDGPRSDSLTAGWRQIEEALNAGEPERAIEIEVGLWVDGPRRAPGEVNAQVRSRVREMNALAWERSAGAHARVEVSPDAVTRLREITAPTIVVAGVDDQTDILDSARRIATEVSSARMVHVANAAHMLNMEQPAQFTEIVRAFVNGLPADS